MQIICPECGQPYDDGEQCWVCVARNEDIEETLSLAFPVALTGISFGSLIALSLYPPLSSNLLVIYMVPGISFVVAVALALLLTDQLTRYATLVRFVIVLVTATFLMPATYYFLNGILDGNPGIKMPVNVLRKDSGGPESGGPYLILRVPLNNERIDASIHVNTRTFSAVEPGDVVMIIVHPGAFSQPWCSDVLPSDDRAHYSR